jgi:hypothetical protein
MIRIIAHPRPARQAGRWLLALALLLAAAARADEGWGLPELMRELAAVPQAQARFVERRYLQILKQPLELSGTLSYVAPGRLIKHTLTPRPERMTVEADRVLIEDLAKGRSRSLSLQDYPVVWAFIESFRATLRGDLAGLERFYRPQFEGARAAWKLSLQPRERRMAAVVSAIRISGSADRINQIEIEETRGDRSVLTVIEESR